MLVPEAIAALTAFADDRAALVMAARTLLDRQAIWGSLWWACGRIVRDLDPRAAAYQVLDEWDADPTRSHLRLALQRQNDDDPVPVVRQVAAGGPDGYLIVANDAFGESEPQDPAELWLTAGIGSVVPEPVWQRILTVMSSAAPRHVELSLVAPSEVAMVVTPKGLLPPDRAGAFSDVPIIPELMRFP